MIEFFGLTLLRPEWLAGLALVALLAAFFAPRGTGLGGWANAVDPALLDALDRMGRVMPGKGGRNWLPALIAGLIAIAALSPAERIRTPQTFRNLDGLVLVLDLSPSVSEDQNFQRTITAAREVLAGAGQRPVSIVVFAGDAYLVSAFTADHGAVGATLALMQPGLVPDTGTRPERGLELAHRSLTDAAILAGDVVLISDGGGVTDATLDVVRRITRSRARVSTLFVPTAAPAAPADEPALVRIAQSGGGASGTIRNVGPVAEILAGDSMARSAASSGLAALVWRDFGRYLLILALFPALMLFRRGA